MGIQRYVFYSIDKCEQHKEVPLMNMKYAVEEYLKASGMNYTVLRLCGFMQPLISGYAVPVLEEQTVWGTDDDTKTAYLDTQDVAKMTLAACRREEAANKTLTLAGPKAYSVNEVIAMCERMGGADGECEQSARFGVEGDARADAVLSVDVAGGGPPRVRGGARVRDQVRRGHEGDVRDLGHGRERHDDVGGVHGGVLLEDLEETQRGGRPVATEGLLPVIDDGCETDRRTDRIGSTTEVETTTRRTGGVWSWRVCFVFHSLINTTETKRNGYGAAAGAAIAPCIKEASEFLSNSTAAVARRALHRASLSSPSPTSAASAARKDATAAT